MEQLLKSHAPLARNGAMMQDWPLRKTLIAALASTGPDDLVASAMVMAHRVEEAVHVEMPDDQLELERILVELMVAATMTHAHFARLRQRESGRFCGSNSPSTADCILTIPFLRLIV